MIELKNIQCKIGDREIFSVKNFTFENGKSYLIKGENGTGKSTLLKAIIGYFKKLKGHIKVEDHIIYQPQQIYLYKKTGWDNFKIIKADKKDVIRLAKSLSVEALLDKNVDVLSGGERQKIAFIRSLLASNQVLMLDEPFSQMDDKSKENACQLALGWKNESKDRTLILITHDNISTKIFDKVLTIEDKELKET